METTGIIGARLVFLGNNGEDNGNYRDYRGYIVI